MIASLPMYDLPEARAATDAWWQGLARHLGVAGELERRPDYSRLWHDTGLIFSQTCGYPLTHEFRGKLRLVATPHYAADGCSGPLYCSIIFAREKIAPEALRGRLAAFNSPDSMSGMLALKLTFAPLAEEGRFFAAAVETGSHLKSMTAVQAGEADVCAIDAVTVALARRYRPQALKSLVEIARSPPVPALPFVTSISRPTSEVERMRDGLAAAFSDPGLADVREALLLNGFSVLGDADYELIVTLERKMEEGGGLILERGRPRPP
jgi:ABC-type phosphate/phosphonate transport system substrate-binding protein